MAHDNNLTIYCSDLNLAINSDIDTVNYLHVLMHAEAIMIKKNVVSGAEKVREKSRECLPGNT